MREFQNTTAKVSYVDNDVTRASLLRFCLLVQKCPHILEPVKGNEEKGIGVILRNCPSHHEDQPAGMDENAPLPFSLGRIPVFAIEGFHFLPTVKRTTLLYDQETDCFYKILQPLAIKYKILTLVSDKTKAVYHLSEKLLAQDINVPKIPAYGTFKKTGKRFYMMRRLQGNSLFDLLKRKQDIGHEMYRKAVEKLAELHNFGFWHGDLRISHVFFHGSEISGFIDIDSIKRNAPFRLRNLAKDLAGLNYPELPLSREDKISLFNHYLSRLRISTGSNFLDLVKYYSDRRWSR